MCDVQRCCSCSCHLWRYIHVGVVPLPFTFTWKCLQRQSAWNGCTTTPAVPSDSWSRGCLDWSHGFYRPHHRTFFSSCFKMLQFIFFCCFVTSYVRRNNALFPVLSSSVSVSVTVSVKPVSVLPFRKRRCRLRHIGEWPGRPSGLAGEFPAHPSGRSSGFLLRQRRK